MFSTRKHVVMRNHVPIFDAEEKEQEHAILARATKHWAGVGEGSWIMDQLSLDAHLVQPPELSTFYLRAKIGARERRIRCTLDVIAENFLVMTLQLDFHGSRYYGLVYDGAKNSLSLLPVPVPAAMKSYHVDWEWEYQRFNSVAIHVPLHLLRRPAVLSLHDGSYDLLNLGLVWEEFDQVLQRRGVLFQWSSSGSPAKWTKQTARLNPQTQLLPGHPKQWMYEDDVVFTFKGKVIWADLLHGAIVCDMLSGDKGDHVELDFIHLPEECQGRYMEKHGNPKWHRTMGRVGDSIMFISIVTSSGDTPRKNTPPADVVLRSWTLAPGLRSWTRDDDMELPLTLLWESEAYRRERLPASVPNNPVLKADEDGVKLYLLLGDYHADRTRKAGEIECVNMRIDMRRKCLLSSSHRPVNDAFHPAAAKGKMNRML